MQKIEYLAIPNFPLIKTGDNISQVILDSCNSNNIDIKPNDIIVIAQKIVSIAEDAIVNLNNVIASAEAQKMAEKTGRSPEECQVFLDESSEILDIIGRHVITRHKIGYVCTSAGIDKSNVSDKKNRLVTLLPKNPDESARKIRHQIASSTGINTAVIIIDSMGKPYRRGSIAEAIGIARIKALEEKESVDLYGNSSKSQVALVDEVAAGASILMGEANEKTPVIIVRGVTYTSSENANIKDLLK